MFNIINNSLNNFVINKDYYLIAFQKWNKDKKQYELGNIIEIKTANTWKQLALKYGINKFSNINVLVVFKDDTYKFGIDNYGNQIITEYTPDFNTDRNNYNNVLFALGTLNFENGTKKTRLLSKIEIDKIKDKSPSKSSDYSPWNNFPIKMIEAKLIREMVSKDIQLDNSKMYAAGYKLVEDEMSLNIINNGEDEVLIQDFQIEEKK